MEQLNSLKNLQEILDKIGIPYHIKDFNNTDFDMLFGPTLPSGILRYYKGIKVLDLGNQFYFSSEAEFLGTTTVYSKSFVPSRKLLDILSQNASPTLQRIKQMVAEKYILYLTAFKTEEELKRIEIILSSFTNDEKQSLKMVDGDCFSILEGRGLL